MVVLRPTRKLRSLLPVEVVESPTSDTALGDWYVNRIIVARRPLLLLVSSTSLLPILIPARNVRQLPVQLAGIVERRLKRFGIDRRAIAAETRAMASVVIGPTVDRSVLGILVDFAKVVPYHFGPGEWGSDALQGVEDQLAETPCYAGRSHDRVIFPERHAPEALRGKWLV